MIDPVCANCRNFANTAAPDAEREGNAADADVRIGTCRRYPPRMVPNGPAGRGYWPRVARDAWCGEHAW